MKLGERIDRLCQERNISIYALANMCPVNQGTLYKIVAAESHNNPTIQSVVQIAAGLDVTVDQLISGVDDWS